MCERRRDLVGPLVSSVCTGCCICRWSSSVNSQPSSKGDSCLPPHQHRWLHSSGQIPIVHVSTQEGIYMAVSATLRKAASLGVSPPLSVCGRKPFRLASQPSLSGHCGAKGPLRILFSPEDLGGYEHPPLIVTSAFSKMSMFS